MSHFSNGTTCDSRKLKVMQTKTSEPLWICAPFQKPEAALWVGSMPHPTPSPKRQFDKMVRNSPEYKSYSFQWRHWEVQPLLNNRTASCHLGFLFFSYGTFTIHGLLNLWKRRRGEPQQYLIWSLENQKFLPLFPISCYKTHQLDTYFCQCSEDYFTGSRV